MPTEFRNEPLTDFSEEENAAAMRAAIGQVKEQLGQEYPLVIGGERIKTGDTLESINPANRTEIIGKFHKATKELASRAVETAYQTFQSWRHVPANERAKLLLRVAAMLRYAGEQPLVKLTGEQNHLEYIPLGVGAVIPPWNFPLAIMAGMTAAAIVTGNTVVLKPSSDSPAIAYQFFELLEEAGLPPGVVNFMAGSGAEVGDVVVDHPKTRFVAFTGSKEVGLRVNERAAKTQPGQLWIKRVVAEMGGKDAIIVADDADLDEAATGVVQSAFGFQGQKCSACSRAIIDARVYDPMIEKISERAAKIKMGDSLDGSATMSAVINEKAFKSINAYIEKGKAEGARVVAGGGSDGEQGFFIEPTVIADVKAGATIEQEEIFGPVLAVIKANDYDDALRIANDTQFGLTGAVYSIDEAKLDRARNEFHVGNLYLNRKCTGALVGVHPFGGFNMSGTDSKAGGRDYLLLFMQAKLSSEKVGATRKRAEAGTAI